MLKTRTFVVAAVLVLAGLQMAFCGDGSQVTLKKPSGEIVQMFARPGSGNGAFADFPSGTACTKLDGPLRVDFGDGMTSDYYKLDCDGATGYVNAKWVR